MDVTEPRKPYSFGKTQLSIRAIVIVNLRHVKLQPRMQRMPSPAYDG
jgi:hypothetical protein